MKLKYFTKVFAKTNGWDYLQMNQSLIDKHLPEDAEITLEVRGDIADTEWEGLPQSLLEKVTSLKPIDAKRIDEETFRMLTGVKTLWIPRTLTIGVEDALAYAVNLESIEVDGRRNPMYCSEDGVLFSSDQTHLIKYPANRKRGVYNMPGAVTQIDSGAFHEVFYLHTITIDHPIRFDAFAVRDCRNLKYLIIKDDGNDSTFAPYCLDGDRLEIIANIDSAAATYSRNFGTAFVGLE